MNSWDKLRKEKPLTCRLCGETDSGVDMWCGAPWGDAHKKCALIASEGIQRYLKHQVWIREARGTQYSEQRGWFCEKCGKLHYIKDGSKCLECDSEMKVTFTFHSSASKVRKDEED